MDRAIPIMNPILNARWVEQTKVKQLRALQEIRQPVFSGRTPNPIPHQRAQARLRKMLKATSRKHRMEEERQDQINHENKLLYKKMTAILKKGAGNISPMRKTNIFENPRGSHSNPVNPVQETEAELLHHGRSVTSQPSVQMSRRIAQNRKSSPSKQHLGLPVDELHEASVGRSASPTARDNSLTTPRTVDGDEQLIDLKLARKNIFKRRYDGRAIGENLVINRKSLNQEQVIKKNEQIRNENLRFLEKL